MIKIKIIRILILRRLKIIVMTANKLGKKPYITMWVGGLIFKFQFIYPIKTIMIRL